MENDGACCVKRVLCSDFGTEFDGREFWWTGTHWNEDGQAAKRYPSRSMAERSVTAFQSLHAGDSILLVLERDMNGGPI